MLKTLTKRHVRLVKVEKPTVWLIVAILLETTGEETIVIGEPRIVKVISKKISLLPGTVRNSNEIYFLSTPKGEISNSSQTISSPYVQEFAYSNLDTLSCFFARPPTEVASS